MGLTLVNPGDTMRATMRKDYSAYKPVILDVADIALLKSDDYARFIMDTVIEPGVRLIEHRRKIRPDYPYVNTKFNPNTGKDFPDSAYGIVYSWVLGRGAESLAAHLPVLENLEGLSGRERIRLASSFREMLDNMTSAMARMIDSNNGLCPFTVNAAFEPVDAAETRTDFPVNIRTFGNIFCSKGLVAQGSPGNVARGCAMIKDIVLHAGDNTLGGDRAPLAQDKICQAGRMLTLGALVLMAKRARVPADRILALDAAAEFIGYILDHHCEAGTALFAEYTDGSGTRRLDLLDPGHANEFVGLGLAAIELMRADPMPQPGQRGKLIERARAMLPRILVKSFELGWNREHEGLRKAVNSATGEVVDNDLPWWNLPETMRAGIRAFEAASDETLRGRCLEAVRKCHNAYFKHYLNPELMLFPYQTRSGATGRVVDKPPALPEGDPLYHANLTLLDYLAVLKRL